MNIFKCPLGGVLKVEKAEKSKSFFEEGKMRYCGGEDPLLPSAGKRLTSFVKKRI